MHVCEVCFNFLQTIYNDKQLKKIKIITKDKASTLHCLSSYHNKLIDSSKS